MCSHATPALIVTELKHRFAHRKNKRDFLNAYKKYRALSFYNVYKSRIVTGSTLNIMLENITLPHCHANWTCEVGGRAKCTSYLLHTERKEKLEC